MEKEIAKLNKALRNAVKAIGWKDVFYAILKFQKEEIKETGYKLKS